MSDQLLGFLTGFAFMLVVMVIVFFVFRKPLKVRYERNKARRNARKNAAKQMNE